MPAIQLSLSLPCVVDGCVLLAVAKGLCATHYKKRWSAEHPGAARAWREANPDYMSEWRRANPERAKAIRERTYAKHREASIERSVSRKRGLRMASSATLEYRLILTCDPCAYCGDDGEEIDHIEPVVLAGSNEWTNLTAACRSCNASKGPRRLLGFLQA